MLRGTKSRVKLSKSIVTKKLFYRKLLCTRLLNFTFTLSVCVCVFEHLKLQSPCVCVCESACMGGQRTMC